MNGRSRKTIIIYLSSHIATETFPTHIHKTHLHANLPLPIRPKGHAHETSHETRAAWILGLPKVTSCARESTGPSNTRAAGDTEQPLPRPVFLEARLSVGGDQEEAKNRSVLQLLIFVLLPPNTSHS